MAALNRLPQACTLFAALCLLCIEVGAFHCPSECSCNNITKSVSCIKKSLKKLPPDLPDDVRKLILSGNRIHDFSGIAKFTELSLLDLSHNKIADIAGLANLTSLTTLDLSDNSLGKWNSKARWLQGLTSLHQLKLTQNNLEQPPAPLCSLLPDLQALFLDNNHMNGLFPEDYSHCRQLTRLTLSNNAFDAIDNTTLCSLRGAAKALPFSLKLNRQKFSNHSSIEPGALTCLADRLLSLDLSQNSLPQEKLEALIGGSSLRRLRSLSLKKSDLLRSVSRQLLAGLTALNTLMLDGSGRLTELVPDAFIPTPLLSHLSLSRTGIAGWKGACLDRLSKLRQLDLRNSSVATIGGLNGSDANSLHQLTDSSGIFANLSLLGAPLACDCSAYWLTQQLALPSVRARLTDAGRLTCAWPAEMRGLPLLGFAPANCGPQPSPAGFFTLRMIVILAASGGAFLLFVFIATLAGVCIVRRRHRGDGEAPRLVFNGVDDMRDPLVAPEDGGRRGDSVWIRLRRFLRQRRESSAASPGQSGRPPIFDPGRQPEDYLAADHVA